MSEVPAIISWMQNGAFGTGIRESIWLFPIIETSHVLALAISVGILIWFDLRLMGVSMRSQPVSGVFRQLRIWMFTGFAIMFTSGALLFASHAAQCYASGYFRAKVNAAVSSRNVLVYHFTIDRNRDEWGKAPIPPVRARLAGFMSLALWVAIIAVGRIFAYHL